MKRLLREPLLQFLVLGAALFGIHGFFMTGAREAPAKIVVSTAQIANLQQTFARSWQRQPTPEELSGLIEDFVRDEVYYREGKALELDRDDIVIRRRIRQKMEFFAEDMAAAEPTDSDLNAYLASHPDAFQREASVSFRQIFLSSRRAEALEADADEVTASLAQARIPNEAVLGDSFLLGDQFEETRESEVANNFGKGFADKLFAAREGSWEGPIASAFGLHFVFVSERIKGGQPPLEEVRESVKREWTNARRVSKLDEFYHSLRDRYEVVVEEAPSAEPQPKEVAGAAQ